MLLNEDMDVTAHEINSETISTLKTFQEVMAIVYDFYHASKRGDKRGQLNSSRDFKKLKTEMKRFHNYPFMAPMIKQLQSVQKELIDNVQAKRQERRVDGSEFELSLNRALSAWKTGDPTKAIQATRELQAFTVSSQKASQTPLKNKFNPFYIENPMIFQSRNFLETFEQSEIRQVIETDFTQSKYSYLPLNELSKNDFQYLAYFILRLRKSPDEINLAGSQLRKYFDMALGGDEYNALIKMVKEYLSNNNKSLLPEIMQKVNQFPEIKSANDRAKHSVTEVFRGYPTYDEEDDETPIQMDDKYMATSKSRRVATNFAMAIGHMEREEDRRSDYGWVETFSVTPDDIILDTTIFGGIFNEEEIIINPRRAKLIARDEV